MATLPRGTTRHLYITEHREKRGWSQEHFGELLAEALGHKEPYGKNTVSRWETEQRAVRPKLQHAMAKVFNIRPEDLWRPPGQLSLDAMIAGQPDDVKRMAADIVARLVSRD